MKKGFTLVELLAVLTLLAFVAIISIPIMETILGNSAQKTKNSQIKEILEASKKYVLKYDNQLEFDDDNELLIPLDDIKKSEFLNDEKMINAETEEEFNGCIYVKYNEETGKTNYAYFYKCETLNYTGKCFEFDEEIGEITGLNTSETGCSYFDTLVIPTYIYGVKVRSVKEIPNDDDSYVAQSDSIDFSKALYLEIVKEEAFGCNIHALKTHDEIDLSNNSLLHTIEDYGFSDGELVIRKVKLPDNLKIIGKKAFAKNSLKEIILPEKLERIGEKAFAENRIERLEIPSSVKVLGKNAFSYNQLKTVTIMNKASSNDFNLYNEPFAENSGFTDKKIIWKQ